MSAGVRLSVFVALFALAGPAAGFAQGTKPAPKTAKPPAKAAAPPVAKPAPPTDVRYKSKYTTGDQVTESAAFFTGQRERYELGDIVLLKQRDQKRNVQISRSANTYVVIADDAPVAAPPAPRPAGVVTMTTSIVDVGERKDMFGATARHVRTVVQREPQPGACDPSKVLVETDGWYIDMPKVMTAGAEPAKASAGGSGCADEVKASESGDPKLLGFAIGYTTTLTDLTDKDAKPSVSSMEVSDFEILKLDASLFDIPAGFNAAADAAAFTKAVSDANETKLASGAVASVAPPKKSGALRIGVPEFGNKTSTTADTRALRARIISELEAQKIDVIPMAAAPQAELDARARDLGVDYLLLAEITALKASKPGGITKVMKSTAKEEARDITEAKLNVQLVAPGAKPRLTKNTSGKDGGVGLKTGLKLAKVAGTVYLKFYMGGMMMGQLSALSNMQMMNIGGMGNVGSMMMPMGYGGSVDRTAGAANFVMQQVMAGAAASANQGGPSFDAALTDAIEDAGKDVIESIKKATPAKQ
ncbi:MAG: hypothetical protein ABI983_01630 [Acidobacteriota bacterium]